MLKRLLIALFAVAVFLPITATEVKADLIKNAYVTMSVPTSTTSNVTHTFYWINQTADIGGITFEYCQSPQGACTDNGSSGATGSLSAITYNAGAESNWVYAWDAGGFRVTLKNPSSTMGGGGQRYVVTLGNMRNPSRALCSYTSTATAGTCYVKISTYNDSNVDGTVLDDGVVSMTITQGVEVSARVDPHFTFLVTAVSGGDVQNGTTTTSGINTTATTIPFGNLTAGSEIFAGHDLTVVSNTDGGYNITAKMTTNLTGAAYSFDIDPFTGNSATYTSAQAWTVPTGGTAGTDTGWLGVGTDDTGVSGRASNAFFSLGAANTTLLMTNNDPTLGETNNIAFGIEVNASQPADSYTGTLIYNAIPVY